MKLISASSNGQIFFCPHNKIVHVEFGCMFVKFTYHDFCHFTNYVKSIDYMFYLEKNQHAQNKRKILLNIGFDDLFLGLNEVEFLELRRLLSLEKCEMMLKSDQICCNMLQLN